jgi:hypothetical protein
LDDVRTSKDQLAKFEGELLNMDIDIRTVRALADNELRNAIEEWDSKRVGIATGARRVFQKKRHPVSKVPSF